MLFEVLDALLGVHVELFPADRELLLLLVGFAATQERRSVREFGNEGKEGGHCSGRGGGRGVKGGVKMRREGSAARDSQRSL